METKKEEGSIVLQQTKEEPTAKEPTASEHEEEAPHDDDDDDDIRTSPSSKSHPPPPTMKPDPYNCIPLRCEVALRMTVASFLAYCLAYAGVAGSIAAIPPSLAWVIGLLGPAVVMRLPIIAPVASPAPILCLMMLIMFGLGCATALLVAATVSDGLFVGMAAIWCFWISGLRFGPTAVYTYIFTGFLAVLFGLIGLGMLGPVQDGIAVQFDRGVLIEIAQGNIDPPESLIELLAAFRKLLEFLEKIITTGRFCFVAEEGFLRGQEVCATYNSEDDTVLVTVKGGIWLIRRIWTTTGINNPFAVVQNFLICVGWTALAALFVAPLLPPVRTARYVLSVRMLPQTLRNVAWYCNRWRPGHQARSEEEMMVCKRLMDSVNLFLGGNVAILTAFEPRVLDYRCGIPRCTWEDLKEVTAQVERAALRALILRSGIVDPGESADRIQASGQIYEKSAVALETRIRVPQYNADERSEDKSPIKNNKKQSTDAENPSLDDSLGFEDSCTRITTAVDNWLVSFHSAKPNDALTFKDGLKNVAKNTLLWWVPAIGFLARLVEIPLLPFLIYKGIYKKDLGMFMHYVKFTIGFTALLCMGIYWDAYRDFELNDKDESEGGVQLVSGGPPTSFVGWYLIAYSFATMATTEGTVKKCVFRLMGTLTGAFSAWALIRACDDNPYGGVAWLTITAFPALYLMIEGSEMALLGPSKDYGYGGFYFVLTQSVIVMEYLAGAGDGDELVLNRIVANFAGIAMATLMAIIPPTNKGSDPKWFDSMLEEIKRSTVAFVTSFLEDDEKSVKEKKLVKLKKAYSLWFGLSRANAKYLLEDAARGSFMPVYKVDKRIEEQFLELSITSSFVSLWMDRAIEATKNNDELFFAKGTEPRSHLESILGAMEMEVGRGDSSEEESIEMEGNEAQVFLGGAEVIIRRIEGHKAALDELQPSPLLGKTDSNCCS